MGMDFKSADEVEIFLNSIPKFSDSGKSAANFNLERMLSFCDVMGNPQEQFPSIHVAGTNGKGTVCRMFASVYSEAGYKTGLYTSPHLLNLKERFRINNTEINPDELPGFFREYGDHIIESGYTFFEITTAIAFWYFAKQNVDLAIIETGLGGRLDATNVLKPELSVITSIGLDHTDILGTTLETIAFEKSGIIKENKPVVIGRLENSAEEVIADHALKKGSALIKATGLNPLFREKKYILHNKPETLVLNAPFGKKADALNAAIVYQGLTCLSHKFPVEEKAFIDGIENLDKKFPITAVFEKLRSDKKWFFDGAHNQEAVKQLTEHLLGLAPAEEWTVVLSFMKDKLNEEVLNYWNSFPNVFLYEMHGERAATFEEMRRFLPGTQAFTKEFLNKPNLFETELVIFSGSFYFYKVVSNWMGTITASC